MGCFVLNPFVVRENANFTYLAPEKPFSISKGQWGAWEFATRFLAGYTRQLSVKGGSITTPTGGNPNNADVIMFRGQVAF